MRKRISSAHPPASHTSSERWIDLESAAEVEITSENPAHPFEAALEPDSDAGWQASEPGRQMLRLIFDTPQELRHIRLIFTENETSRTQEFLLRWSAGSAATHEIVRQQYNFSPGSREVEDYAVNLSGVKVLELEINPSISGGDFLASLAEIRVR